MPQLVDFAAQEVAIDQASLPLNLASGSEILLTSIFLRIPDVNANIKIQATVGWEVQLTLLPITPAVTFRIRRGGSGPTDPLLYETTDSTFLGAGNLVPVLTGDLTMSLQHAAMPDNPNIVGTYQQYFLTAQLTSTGGATIVGPVTLAGMVFN